MTVRSKPKMSVYRARRSGRDTEHGAASVRQLNELQGGPAGSRNRCQGGQSEDRALYTCSCGFAFDALVSTSVGCPHCGNTQAW